MLLHQRPMVDFKIIWQQWLWVGPLLSHYGLLKKKWPLGDRAIFASLSSSEHSGPWASCLSLFLNPGQTFRVYECGTEGPVLFFLHGGGFSALSWALLSVSYCTAKGKWKHRKTSVRKKSWKREQMCLVFWR